MKAKIFKIHYILFRFSQEVHNIKSVKSADKELFILTDREITSSFADVTLLTFDVRVVPIQTSPAFWS